jgi:hypothetical protein
MEEICRCGCVVAGPNSHVSNQGDVARGVASGRHGEIESIIQQEQPMSEVRCKSFQDELKRLLEEIELECGCANAGGSFCQ